MDSFVFQRSPKTVQLKVNRITNGFFCSLWLLSWYRLCLLDFSEWENPLIKVRTSFKLSVISRPLAEVWEPKDYHNLASNSPMSR